eukprot:6176801-Pleurochrysis_carterae.AAC.1
MSSLHSRLINKSQAFDACMVRHIEPQDTHVRTHCRTQIHRTARDTPYLVICTVKCASTVRHQVVIQRDLQGCNTSHLTARGVLRRASRPHPFRSPPHMTRQASLAARRRESAYCATAAP